MSNLRDKITLNLDGDEKVSITGCIAPIEYTQHNYHVDWNELANLKAAEAEKQYHTFIFQAFLPLNPVSVGDCWKIEEEGVLTLLRQLNPHPQLVLDTDSGDSYGLWACLRAYNDEFAEILFRIHAEFVLEKGYFAPSQFTGQLVIDQGVRKIVSFKMYVPEATLNFDVRWRLFGDERLAADNGFCPKMELCAGTQVVWQNTEFTEAITHEEAWQELMLRFYKSARINWVPLEKAVELAPALQKPIHAISLDGPLADESC